MTGKESPKGKSANNIKKPKQNGESKDSEESLHSLKTSILEEIAKVNQEVAKINQNLLSFQQYVANELTSVKLKLEDMGNRISNTEFLIGENTDKVKTNSRTISTNCDKISNMEKIISNLQKQMNEMKLNSKSMNTALDDSINRSMRNTLVIKGLKEEGEETYQQTTDVIARLIHGIDPTIATETVKNDIERAHRETKSNTTNKKPRFIFVKFHSWQKSELYKRTIQTHSISNNNFTISVDQMYSKEVFNRRNEALKVRRSRIEEGDTRKMYVKYPAKLMVKQNNKYIVLKEF